MELLAGSATALTSFVRAIRSSYAVDSTVVGMMLVYSVRTTTLAVLTATTVSARCSAQVCKYFYVNRLYLYDINNLINLKLSCNMFFQFSFYLYNTISFLPSFFIFWTCQFIRQLIKIYLTKPLWIIPIYTNFKIKQYNFWNIGKINNKHLT